MIKEAQSNTYEAVVQNDHGITPINRSIGTAIICNTVFILPLMPAATTIPSDAATVLIPPMINSLDKITMSIQAGINPFSTIQQKAEYTNILSARGSIIFPKFVIILYSRAILPSIRSVKAATTKIINAGSI